MSRGARALILWRAAGSAESSRAPEVLLILWRAREPAGSSRGLQSRKKNGLSMTGSEVLQPSKLRGLWGCSIRIPYPIRCCPKSCRLRGFCSPPSSEVLRITPSPPISTQNKDLRALTATKQPPSGGATMATT